MNRPLDGGVPARRAVVRWAGRLFRRDWRQHLLIVVLLTVAVAVAAGLTCAAFNLAPASGRAEFGDADHFFRFDDPDPATLPAKLDAARSWFGVIEAIGHRQVAVPGTATQVDYRAQQADGPFSRPLLELRAGRYPTADGEAAVTDQIRRDLGVRLGSTVDLDGVPRKVVGVVRNPSDFGDDFVLLPPSAVATSDSVTMLVKASEDRVESFRPPGARGRVVGSRGDAPQDVVAAVTTLVASTLLLSLVALVGAASFTVIAQRRLPQLGMMTAVGATEKHIRLAMLASGAVTGLVAAVLGTFVGVVTWLALSTDMQGAVGYRIDAWNVPWLVIGAGMVLAIIAATAAAWWPGRTMSRIPPMLALSGRPPEPRAVHRSAVVAIVLLVTGALALATGSKVNGRLSMLDLALIVVGLLAVMAGVLLVSPLAIRALGRAAPRVPIASRLALRDLGRYQARSGAALAAIALALGIPVAVVAAAAAAENNIGPGNLASTQLLIRPSDLDGPFIPDTAAIAELQVGVDELEKALPDATVTRLDVATTADAEPEPGLAGVPAFSVARWTGDGWTDLSPVYVATPALLRVLGLQAEDLAGRDIVTRDRGPLDLMGPGLPRPRVDGPQHLVGAGGLPAGYSSLPAVLISPERLAERGWQAAPSGRWVVTATRPFTSEDLSEARVVAAQHGFTIERRDVPTRLTAMRLGAVAIGMLLALAILAMTIGLIRSESAGEARTLTATGATSSARRTITATTAAGLAGLGALLGIAGAYLALAAGRLSHLTPLPLRDLLIIAAGTPLLAAACGWCFAGREPAVLARRPIE
jgi:putative ABC transport system permease protein